MRWFSFLLLLLATVAPAPAQKIERVLDRVLFIKDKPGSLLKFRMVVNAGCLDEENGQCRGLAHYLEHLVLVGRNPEHKSAAIRMFGDGNANGYTNMRATVYIHDLPNRAGGSRDDLTTLFNFYAARLTDFAIPEDEAVRERNIVLQEHDWRVQSNPYLLAWRDLTRKLLPDHPFGQWTIGTREDIQTFTVAQAKAYLRNWHAINNVWFLVTGDVDAADVKAVAEKALAGLSPRTLPPRNFAKRPEFGNERFDHAVSGPQFRIAGAQVMKVVRMAEPDVAKNRAVRAVLSNFLSSELPGSPREVMTGENRPPTARAVIAHLERVAPETFRLGLGADAATGVTPVAARDALVAYLDGLAAGEALSDAVVERIKSRILRNLEDVDRNSSRRFTQLEHWLANRNMPEELAVWPEKLKSVTGQEVRDLARALAGPGRIVTQIVQPTGGAQ